MLIRGVVEVFETTTLSEVFVVVLITEDVEKIAESALALTSLFAVVIAVLKILEAVVDTVMPVAEVDRVVEFVVEESFKDVEESIGIRMGLLAVGSVAVVGRVVIAATTAVIADNEDIEIGFEVLVIALVSNVVVSKEVRERFISAENNFGVVRVDVPSVETDSAITIVFIVRWGVVVSPGESVVIGFEIVACNNGVVVLITVVDNTTALSGRAAVVFEVIIVTEIFVFSS